MDLAWRRCKVKDAEVSEELRECRKRGKETPRYLTLVRDARKLKAEYEKVCRAPESNPLKVSHGERFTKEKITGDLLGRNGPDTHHSIDGNKSRPPEMK
jgi:hypothetical protein